MARANVDDDLQLEIAAREVNLQIEQCGANLFASFKEICQLKWNNMQESGRSSHWSQPAALRRAHTYIHTYIIYFYKSSSFQLGVSLQPAARRRAYTHIYA